MTLVLCHCANRRLPDQGRLERLRAAVLGAGGRVVDVGDLCAAAVEAGAGLRSALAEAGAILAGCHERALRALAWRLAGAEVPGLRFVDLREAGAEVPPGVPGLAGVAAAPAEALAIPPSPDAWYPLVDAERCTDCGTCQSFCLFGVYSRDSAGAMRVAQPLNCKLDCPACARVCPENAILFPKCADDAINGALRSPDQLQGARIRLSPEEVCGGDLRAKLAARRAAAGSRLFRPGVFGSGPDAPSGGGPQT